jgi:hypothetical protein
MNMKKTNMNMNLFYLSKIQIVRIMDPDYSFRDNVQILLAWKMRSSAMLFNYFQEI